MYLSRGDGFGEALGRQAAAGLVRNCLMKDFIKKINSLDRLVGSGVFWYTRELEPSLSVAQFGLESPSFCVG